MDADKSVQADRAIEGRERLVERGLRGERVARGKHVAGVEADARSLPKAGLGVDHLEHLPDLLESRSQTRPLPGGRFDQDPGGEFGGLPECFGDACRGSGHGPLQSLFARRARMGHDPGDA